MNAHKQIIEEFYAAFADHNPEGMISCYHPDIIFRDPAFGTLKKEEVAAMWKMLVENSKGNLDIRFYNIEADETTGQADWTASYTFSGTGRAVVNKIHARFRFKEGLIVEHHDDFNIWKWSSQALGISGTLFGWTGFMQSRIREKARRMLKKYMRN